MASLSSPPCHAVCRGRDRSRVDLPSRATSGPRPHGGAGQLRGPIAGTGKPSLCSGIGWRAPLLCGPSVLLLGTQAAPPPSPRPHRRSFGGRDTSPHSLGSKFIPPLLTFCSCVLALPWALECSFLTIVLCRDMAVCKRTCGPCPSAVVSSELVCVVGVGTPARILGT